MSWINMRETIADTFTKQLDIHLRGYLFGNKIHLTNLILTNHILQGGNRTTCHLTYDAKYLLS